MSKDAVVPSGNYFLDITQPSSGFTIPNQNVYLTQVPIPQDLRVILLAKKYFTEISKAAVIPTG